MLGLAFEVIPSNLDEKSIRDDNPMELARKLSEAKAKAVGESNEGIIIAADLFVVFNNKIYEKPKNEKEAFEMLKSFSRNCLDIISGLAIYNSISGRMLSTAEKATVNFRELVDHEIQDYISKYPVVTFSAAFDGDGLLRFAEKVQGPFVFNSGMPMNKLIPFLREHGVSV